MPLPSGGPGLDGDSVRHGPSSTDHQRVGIPDGSLTGRSAQRHTARQEQLNGIPHRRRAHRPLAAAADRLVPHRPTGIPAPPRWASSTTSTGCSTRSRSIRHASGPADRSRVGPVVPRSSDISWNSRRSRRWRGAPASRVRSEFPNARGWDPSSGGSSSTAPVSLRSAPTFPACTPEEQDARLDAAASSAPSSTSTWSRARTPHPSTWATATSAAGRRSASPATSSRAATPTRKWRDGRERRREGMGRGRHRDRSGGRHRGRGPDRGRLVGPDAREGSQPPARARRAVRPARARLQRRAEVHAPALPRSRPVARAAHVPPQHRRRRAARGRRRQQPPVHGGRRRLPCRRQAPPLPRGRLQAAQRSRTGGGRRARRLARRLRRDGAVLRGRRADRRRRRGGRRQSVRVLAGGPVPDARRVRTCTARS